MFLSDETVENFYNTNFTLMFYYHWSLGDIEGMFPYERTIYVSMIKNYQNQLQQKQQQQ